MALLTYFEAVDQIYSLLKNTWESGSSSIAGYVPKIYWPGDIPSGTLPGELFSLRVSIQTVASPQATLSNKVIEDNKKRFFSMQLLVMQLHCPQIVMDSYFKGQQLGMLLVDAYRGGTSNSGVWYTEARLRELPPMDVFHRFDVIVNCFHDELG